MIIQDVALVLEGGGFRGAYTAGALKWLADHDIYFADTYAISASAAISFFYCSKQSDAVHDLAIKGFTDKKFIGLPAILSEGTICAFEHMRKTYMLPYYKQGLQSMKETGIRQNIGMYSTTNDRLEYFSNSQFDDEAQLLKSSCVLPISGKQTIVGGEQFLDGGIDTMVPCKKAQEDGYQKQLVIVTKYYGYERKPNGKVLSFLLHLVYHKYKNMLSMLDDRVNRYNEQMKRAQDLDDSGMGILVRPSFDSGVSRFSATEEQLEVSFQLGYDDMEKRKDRIFKLLNL